MGADEAQKRTAPLLTKDAGVLYNVGRKGATYRVDIHRNGLCSKDQDRLQVPAARRFSFYRLFDLPSAYAPSTKPATARRTLSNSTIDIRITSASVQHVAEGTTL